MLSRSHTLPLAAPEPHRPSAGQGFAMDRIYRWQRHIYDLTRKYFLFGRDSLIAGLALAEGGAVLELGCGTGRNLAQVARAWPRAGLYGLDISAEMLKTARGRLEGRACLALGDACAVDAAALFGRESFDRVVISFALSMIPQWERVVDEACRLTAPGGTVHIVDFGDCAGLMPALRLALRRWLERFSVTPRGDLVEVCAAAAGRHGMRWEMARGRFGYFRLVTIRALADTGRP